ncbi:WLM domain-containing protein [Tetraselmis virus 1]|uniref:WLM domain-containing protein n=1 Tax=Tetraselmis virus 1 TaxID=2060617 RepID=A0A2P0VP57_9VIRU|nr:WLM domain-containing protein [Tetraselmis virus 1]AUF82650.1 WLM domain-containing protein [Tetraselmis virus 1]
MTFYDAFAVSMALVVVGTYLMNRWRDVEYVVSDIDNQTYLVRKAEDSLQAANMLARLNDKVQRLIRHLIQKYPNDDRTLLLDERYNPKALSEGTEEVGYTSYSINKGERIVMCLRSRDVKSSIEKENTLMYVLIHELAHLATPEVGHTKQFWRNFKFLIHEAVELGIYVDKDYSKKPVSYCGIKIDSSSITQNPQKSEL